MSSAPVVFSGARVESVLPSSHELGEGAIFHGGRYLHVDIYGPSGSGQPGPAVYSHDVSSGALRAYPMPSFVGTVVPCADGRRAAVALRDGVWALDLASGALSRLFPGLAPGADRRFNDGKAAPDGRLWVGSMGAPGKVAPGAGTLYVCEPDGATFRAALPGVTISNGLAWAPDGRTMYYIDTPEDAVFAFDYDAATGAIANKRVAFAIPAGTGHPDGCCIDAAGNLWVAQWGGSRVVAYNTATGAVVAEVRLPAAHVSSVTFGGDGLGDLYITTAKEHLSPEERAAQPHAGDIFMVKNCGFKGLPACTFALKA